MKRLLILAVLLCLGAALLQAQTPSTSPNVFYIGHPTRIGDISGHPVIRSSKRCTATFAQDSVYLGTTNVGVLATIQVVVDSPGVMGTDSVLVALGHDTTAAYSVPLLPSVVSGQPFDGLLLENISNPVFIMIKSPVNVKRRVVAY